MLATSPIVGDVDRIVVAVIGALLLMLFISLLRPRNFRERVARAWRR